MANEIQGRANVEGNKKTTVLNPMGYPPKVTRKAMAPRLDTLDGKTRLPGRLPLRRLRRVPEADAGWFAEHMPAVKTVV